MENNTNTTPTTTKETSKPSSSTVSRTVLLVMRVLTFVLLFIALILIAVAKETIDPYNEYDRTKIKFQDIHAFRYMISTIVIGFVYNLLQMALSIFTMSSGNRVLNGDVGYNFDFYGDKIISYVLLSGSAAGFGASVDLQRFSDEDQNLPLILFFGNANASASLLLFGFIATAVASVFTSFALPKKAN